jgi:signal peptidase II
MTFINKFFLTSMRIIFVVVITWYIVRKVTKGARWRFLVCLALVLAGAIGNIIDCLFYGMVFTESTLYDIAQLVPWGEGYGEMFYGKVVDMFYFPFIDTILPEWIPFYGGEHFVFFAPVFNFADACISVGFVSLLLFCSKEMGSWGSYQKEEAQEVDAEKQE